jgi:hypothetical protein
MKPGKRWVAQIPPSDEPDEGWLARDAALDRLRRAFKRAKQRPAK